jgi:hypothetical protein
VARTGGSLVDPRFAVSTLTRYLDPWPGVMRPTRLFPFVEWGAPARPLLGMPVNVENTGSLPTSAPLLVLCAAVGVWWLWRRRGRTVWAVPVAATLLASLVTFAFWSMSHRYLVDLVPPAAVLALPGAWLALCWLGEGSRARRAAVLSVAGAVAVTAALGQTGIAIYSHHFEYLPDGVSTNEFVRLRYSIDDSLFGGPPPRVRRVSEAMPPFEAGETVIVGDCSAVYFGQYAWVPVERKSGGGRRAVILAKEVVAGYGSVTVPVVTGTGWRVEARPVGMDGYAQIVYVGPDGPPVLGAVIGAIDARIALDVVADPWTGEVSVFQAGRPALDVLGVAADGLTVASGWTLFPGGDPFCRSLAARMPAP